jgi:hypothetical protein
MSSVTLPDIMTTLEILKQLQFLAEREAQGDRLAHLELLKGLQQLQNAVTTPHEKITRLIHQVQQNISLRLAQEYGILQALVASSQATAGQLSAAVNVDEFTIGNCRV